MILCNKCEQMKKIVLKWTSSKMCSFWSAVMSLANAQSLVITTTIKILNSFISFFVNFPSSAAVLCNHSSVLHPSHFAFSKMSYKWTHTICSLWGLIYFTQQNAFEIHPCYCLYTHIFVLFIDP